MSAVLLLADKTGEAAKAGPIGLVVIIVLCVACYFLFKSMSKHLKRVREQFPADPSATPSGRTPADVQQPQQVAQEPTQGTDGPAA